MYYILSLDSYLFEELQTANGYYYFSRAFEVMRRMQEKTGKDYEIIKISCEYNTADEKEREKESADAN